MSSTYTDTCRRLAELRAEVGPGSTVYVWHTIDRRRSHYEATLVARLESGRYLLRVELLGKTYRIITDARNVATTKGKVE